MQSLAAGAWLKAIALAKQAVQIGDKYLGGPSKSALQTLAEAFDKGGLYSEAERVRARIRSLS